MSATPSGSVMAQASSIVTTLRPNDVLCGRGSGPNDHVGNINFRSLIYERRDEYLSTSNRAAKAKIAKEVVEHVWSLEPPGRFLEKANTKCDNTWRVVSNDKALEKAKQALRQNREKRTNTKGSGSESESNNDNGIPSIVTPEWMKISKGTKIKRLISKPNESDKPSQVLYETNESVKPVRAVSDDAIGPANSVAKKAENGDDGSPRNSIEDTFNSVGSFDAACCTIEINQKLAIRHSVGIGRDSYVTDDVRQTPDLEPTKLSTSINPDPEPTQFPTVVQPNPVLTQYPTVVQPNPELTQYPTVVQPNPELTQLPTVVQGSFEQDMQSIQTSISSLLNESSTTDTSSKINSQNTSSTLKRYGRVRRARSGGSYVLSSSLQSSSQSRTRTTTSGDFSVSELDPLPLNEGMESSTQFSSSLLPYVGPLMESASARSSVRTSDSSTRVSMSMSLSDVESLTPRSVGEMCRYDNSLCDDMSTSICMEIVNALQESEVTMFDQKIIEEEGSEY